MRVSRGSSRRQRSEAQYLPLALRARTRRRFSAAFLTFARLFSFFFDRFDFTTGMGALLDDETGALLSETAPIPKNDRTGLGNSV